MKLRKFVRRGQRVSAIWLDGDERFLLFRQSAGGSWRIHAIDTHPSCQESQRFLQGIGLDRAEFATRQQAAETLRLALEGEH